MSSIPPTKTSLLQRILDCKAQILARYELFDNSVSTGTGIPNIGHLNVSTSNNNNNSSNNSSTSSPVPTPADVLAAQRFQDLLLLETYINQLNENSTQQEINQLQLQVNEIKTTVDGLISTSLMILTPEE